MWLHFQAFSIELLERGRTFLGKENSGNYRSSYCKESLTVLAKETRLDGTNRLYLLDKKETM